MNATLHMVELHTSVNDNKFISVHNGDDEIHVVKVLISGKFGVIRTIVFIFCLMLKCSKRERR